MPTPIVLFLKKFTNEAGITRPPQLVVIDWRHVIVPSVHVMTPEFRDFDWEVAVADHNYTIWNVPHVHVFARFLHGTPLDDALRRVHGPGGVNETMNVLLELGQPAEDVYRTLCQLVPFDL